MDLKSIPQYKDTLETMLVTWESVKQTKQQAIILLEAPSGMKKTEMVLSFLEGSKATCVRSRGTGVPSPYLPFHMAYQSIFELDEVQQAKNTSQMDHLPVKTQRILKSVISSTPFLQPVAVPDWVLSHQWQTPYQPTFEQETSPEEDHSTFPRPITLPGRLATTLSELAAASPIVFFLDDLDLVDNASLEALSRELLPALQSVPILFLFAFGSVPPTENDSVSKFIQNTRINFSPKYLLPSLLQEESVKQIVATAFAKWRQPLADDLITKVIQSANGNLAQLQDLLNWLHQRYLKKDLVLPEEIPNHASLMNEQFSQLPQIQQEILYLASCQGRYFCAEVVASILAKSSPLVLESLNRMSDENGWVRADSDLSIESQILHWYRFRGYKRHEWTYEAVPEAQLLAYHRQTGQALETIYSKSAKDIAGLLAYQFEKAEDCVKAAEYFSLLANQANRQGDAVSAQLYAEKGLKYLGGDKRYKKLICHLTAEQGKAYQRGEKAYLAIDILQKAQNLAADLNLTGELIEDIDYHLGQALLDSNRWDSGMEILHRSIDQALMAENWLRAAEIFESLRVAFYRRGDTAFLDKCDGVIDILKKEESPLANVAIAEILEDKGWFYLERRDIGLAVQTFAKAFTILSNLEDKNSYPEILYKLYRWQASALRYAKDLQGALASAQNAIEWAAPTLRRDYEAEANMMKAVIHYYLGQLEDAQEGHKKALSLLEFSSRLDKLAQMESEYGLFLSNTGRKAHALKYYQNSYEHSVKANHHRRAQIARNNRASISKHLGRFSDALADYQQLLNEGIAQEDVARQIVSLNHIGDIFRVQGNLVESEKCHLQAAQLCDVMSKLGSKLISLRYLMRTNIAELKYAEAKSVLDQLYDLHTRNVGTNRDHYRSQIYEYRLALVNSNFQGSFNGLTHVAGNLEKIKDSLWLGLTYQNLSLCHLLRGEFHEAISQSQAALSTLGDTESWQVSDAYHLLARCHLAVGNLNEAKKGIAEAKTRYMQLQLFNRVSLAEITETAIEIAQETDSWNQGQKFTIDELEQTFRYVGI
jgi:tetratricopeptide (TPR) repeat protein